WEARERWLARFAPIGLLLLPAVWATGVVLGASGVFWALGTRPWRDAVVLAGSSFTTLGFRSADDLPSLLTAVAVAVLGLGLVALLISFLPTIYGAFSRREAAVAKLHLRATGADGVAEPATLLIRAHLVGGLVQLSEVWAEWENWFVELEETHTSFPMLVFFRSPVPERSWITSAGLALDTAALYSSTVALDRHPRAALMIRTGTLALRRINDQLGFAYDPDPAPTDPISISREEYLEVYERLCAAGVPVRSRREQAWADFAGWRVNYDVPLLSLAAFVEAPPAPWSSDRGRITRPAPKRRRRRP
ncbi:MAG: hypothetical protein D6683_10560, partial [Actinomyces sp.]